MRPPGLSPPASFSWSGSTQPSKLQGHGSQVPEKTGVDGLRTTRDGMQRLQERPLADLFRYNTTSWMDLVHQMSSRTRGPASGCPLVVMVQPTYSGNSDHSVACMMRGKSRSARFRNLLRHPLMRSRLVEVGHIVIEHAARAASRRR